MKKKLSVRQNGFKDCASACLLSIIRYYNGDMSINEISYLIKTDEHGTNAFNLIEGAKTLGFSGYGMKASFKELIKNQYHYPVIAHTKKSNMYHYVVIYEIKKNTIKIMDPAYGIKKVSYNDFDEMYLGVIINLYPVKKISKLSNKNKLLKEMICFLLTDKKNLIKIITLSVFVTVLSIVNNFYFKVLIDYVYESFTLKLLITIFISFSLIIFLKCVFDNIRSKLLISIKANIGSFVTNNVIEHIINLPYCLYKNKPTGELISRIDDLDNFKELTANVILSVFVNILLMFCSVAVLILINKTLFLVSILIIILYSIVVFIYSIIFKNKIYDIQVSDGEYKKNLIELIEGYETFKNLNVSYSMFHKLKMKYNSLLYKLKSFEFTYANQLLFKNIISDIGLLLIGTIGLWLVNLGVITIGDIVVFSSLVLFFIEPIKELLNLEPSIRYAIGSYERINDLYMIKKEEINNVDKSKIYGDIYVDNLSYSYNNIDYVFNGLSLKFKKHSNYLIYGDSGNGKSTFIKILLKYFEDYKGNILVNDINLKDLNNQTVRNSITYVSQKEVLLNDTIKNNIILGRKIKDSEYYNIIKLCKVDEIINKKEQRDNFLLEDNGFNLSGGERQRIILARGLLKDSNYIILDEVLSEVRFDQEKQIIKGIFKKYEKNTVIYISHKDEVKSLFDNKYDFSKKGEGYVNRL